MRLTWSRPAGKTALSSCRSFNASATNRGRKTRLPLLTKYPELDLTPDVPSDNKGFYCREWNPLDPKVNEIVFPLIDELVDAFDAKAVHVGMDEVFLLASEDAKTKGHDPADVFAKTVNDLHDHIVGQRGLTMLMWADRLIDGKQLKMGEWEASQVGTAAAIDKIPKDIILCPWHYEPREGGAYRVGADVHGKRLPCAAGQLEEHRRRPRAHPLLPRPSNRRPPRRPHLYDLVRQAQHKLGRVGTDRQRSRTT